MYRKKLLDLGIPGNFDGFEYLNYALEIYKPPCKTCVLYDEIAQHFNTTRARVERATRHAINKSGECITNGEFIAKYKILWEEEEKR